MRFGAQCFPNPDLHMSCCPLETCSDLAQYAKCAHHPPCCRASLIAQTHVDADANAALTAAVAKTSGLPDGVAAAAAAGKHAGQRWGGRVSREVADGPLRAA